MKNTPLKQRLADMTDRTLRHNYSIGDYWNVAEEAATRIEELEGLASRWEKIADQRAIEVADLKVGLSKSQQSGPNSTQWADFGFGEPPRDCPILGVVEGKVRVIQWGKTSHVPMYGWCLADQGPEEFDLCKPTHWRPLPQPPATSSSPIPDRQAP